MDWSLWGYRIQRWYLGKMQDRAARLATNPAASATTRANARNLRDEYGRRWHVLNDAIINIAVQRKN